MEHRPNTTDIKNRKPEEVFDSETAEEYWHRIETLSSNLVTANASMLIIQQVIEFPSGMFLSPERQTFLKLVTENFVAQIVLTLTNFFEKKEPKYQENLTFTVLCRWIRDNCRQASKTEVTAYLDQLKPPQDVAEPLARVRRLRHKLVAHLDLQHGINEALRQEARLTFTELRELLDVANSLCHQLCFGHSRSLLPLDYMPGVEYPVGMDPRADIEYFLDLLAADSAMLRMPEEQPEFWPHHANNMTPEDRATFNHWRKRVGLSEVTFE